LSDSDLEQALGSFRAPFTPSAGGTGVLRRAVIRSPAPMKVLADEARIP